MSEYRQDPVTGRWVIIASGRASRPWHIPLPSKQNATEPCPFCAGHEAMTPPEVWADRDSNTQADAPGWRVRVVPNKYPAVEDSGEERGKPDGFHQSMNGAGVHEVIIESPSHAVNLSALGIDQLIHVLRAYRARLRALKNDPRWRYLLIYKNHGERAGATFEHVHSQLVALPFIPREARHEIEGVRKHFDVTRRCIYCDIIRSERERGERLVSQSDRFVALCPFAPRFGFETWILPNSHAANFEEISSAELAALAESLRALVIKLNSIAENAPFNLVIDTAPKEASASQRYHWHMEILPQLTRAAGFEWGTGMHINSVAPEDAARLLRDGAL